MGSVYGLRTALWGALGLIIFIPISRACFETDVYNMPTYMTGIYVVVSLLSFFINICCLTAFLWGVYTAVGYLDNLTNTGPPVKKALRPIQPQQPTRPIQSCHDELYPFHYPYRRSPTSWDLNDPIYNELLRRSKPRTNDKPKEYPIVVRQSKDYPVVIWKP